MKPKQASPQQSGASYDRCQTPPYAVGPLLPYLPNVLLWEPAIGEGLLAWALEQAGYQVMGSDVLLGQDYFTMDPPQGDYCQVTNPPYSLKYQWLNRAYEQGQPFALLLPVETMGAAKAQKLFKRYGVEVILLNRRVNFKMPGKGFGGTAQFPTCWVTWGLGIGQQLTFGDIVYSGA